MTRQKFHKQYGWVQTVAGKVVLAGVTAVCLILAVAPYPRGLAQTGGNTPTAAPPLILTDDRLQYPLAQHLEILKDPTGNLTINDVTSPAYASRFVPARGNIPAGGFSRPPYWVRFRVRNHSSDTDWLLDTGALYTSIDFFDPLPDGQGFKHIQTGRMYPFATRDVTHHRYIFLTTVPPQTEETFYVRLEQAWPMTLPFTWWGETGFLQQDHIEQFIIGAVVGILLITLAYNLILFLSVKDAAYFFGL